MIQVENVSKTYRKSDVPAVRNLNLELRNGEIVGFAGLNGAGKSTTIRLITGILFPDSGNIVIDGKDIVEDKIAASRNIGWVPELPIYDLNSSPDRLLRYFSGYYSGKKEEIAEKRISLMKQFGIWEYRDRKLRNFSQGMKKRFSIVAASQSDPDNYLFDETLNGLDPEGVRDTRKYILSLKERRKCVLLSSHILSELQLVADRIAIISRGELLTVLQKNEINSLGSNFISIAIENPDSRAKGLMELYGDVYQEGKYFAIRNLKTPEREAYEVSRAIINAGYRLSHFAVTGEDLESYFLELVGAKK